ncbi:Polyhomeotic-proximal chromatin protein [Pseudolycoriella hygida]|uniref:Polyhomeotic-proximal chromatin protein n=1 Tax=Pseudolycoriella hygida TaxID=35572 RepID=A0A9Q0MR93_9DIPT|nr:Polyhomeotic-proximal chromatin protein [Pseudolycoriella hygida]
MISEHYDNLQKEEEKLNNSINNNNSQVTSAVPNLKSDASNQLKVGQLQQGVHTVATSAGNNTPIATTPPATTPTTEDGKENEVTPMDTTPPEVDDTTKADSKSIDAAITPTTTAVRIETTSSWTTSTNSSTLTTTTNVADVSDCIGGTTSSSSISNGTTVPTTCNAASSPSNNLLNNNNKNEKGLPKAMVKPNVLTHVIGDYVIQEANEPFPLTRQRYPDDAADEPPRKRQAIEAVEKPATSCENCRKLESKSTKKKKSFCSPACAKAAKSTEEQTTQKSADQSAVNEPTTNGITPKQQPNAPSDVEPPLENRTNDRTPEAVAKWTVAEECSAHAEDFVNQEIDGQALLLLKEDNLVNVMQMKLGPAVKLVARVKAMFESNQDQ